MPWLPAILIIPYFYLLLKIYRSLQKIKPFEAAGEPVTLVSVVVACRNEEEHIPELLKGISEQDYPPQLLQIIIVNDNSNDRTAEIVSDFKGRVAILNLNNEGRGKKEAIKTGISAASGKLIITTDADCLMGMSWVRTIAAFYEKHIPDMIICPVQIESSRGIFSRFQELEFMSLQGITAGSAYKGDATMCNGANLAFTKEAYMNNSCNLNFEIASGDDIFFLHSLKKQKGSEILWLESAHAMVTTALSPSAGSFLRQRRRWISKSKSYSDQSSVLLGIVTFVAILLQMTLLIAGFINQNYLLVFLTVFLFKSVPDYLILRNTTGRYGRKELMNWFIPAQTVYPFYVLLVLIYALLLPENQEH
jgi:glycosyltransferase involved in cell wall biosynthesis